MMHTTGILLTYYEPYVANAVKWFDALLQSLPGMHSIIVVHNGPDRLQLGRPDMVLLTGDNSLREFSGWQTGLNHCRATGLIENSELVVFANDTFCHHNKFGPVTRWAFRRGLRELQCAPAVPALAGETFCLGRPYSIDGLKADAWVATYLFGMSRSLLERMENLTPDVPLDNFYLREDNCVLFNDRISPNLARHIETWLLGTGPARWPGSGNSEGTRTLEQLRGKADSILCEKYLSMQALARGATLSNVMESSVLRSLRRFEALSEKLAHPFGKRSLNLYQA